MPRKTKDITVIVDTRLSCPHEVTMIRGYATPKKGDRDFHRPLFSDSKREIFRVRVQ